MSTLRLPEFGRFSAGINLTRVLAEQPPRGGAQQNPMTIESITRFLRSDKPHGRYTFSGRLGGLSGPLSNADQELICKFAISNQADPQSDPVSRLKTEYEAYTCLDALQGVVIPRCYGLFVGEAIISEKTRIGCACLLLQYCGEPIAAPLPELEVPFEIRMQYLSAVQKIHEAGYKLDVLPDHRHILSLSSNIYIIGLQNVERHKYKCKGVPSPVRLHQPYPHKEDFCPEIYLAAQEAGVWIQATIMFCGKYIWLQDVLTENHELLAERLLEYAPDSISKADAVEKAEELAKAFNEAYERRGRRERHRFPL